MKLNKFNTKLYTAFLFFLRLVIFSVPLYLMIWLNIDMFYLEYLQANVTSSVLTKLGYNNTLEIITDTQYTGLPIPALVFDAFTIGIGRPCTGIRSVLAFLALVFAMVNIDMKRKIVALLFVPIIFMVNVFRLVTTVILGYKFGLEFVHSFLWQWGMLLVILLFWLAWFRVVSR
ncbi:MAG TPA: exosortase/archaeosortase family protein [Candidatus Aenigmarchaeota archaeon]|nr:MAG: hypothetical protein DRN75_01535 [Nanoarchaeota archaeon]HDO79800.1 exosortase/archaeosortase family protein [Candidatus Aenigmarchaeota archaeon]HEX32852.1 exosortase/archaeosortase family protein [Candidatus Aenigmarchaeota archaeon]